MTVAAFRSGSRRRTSKDQKSGWRFFGTPVKSFLFLCVVFMSALYAFLTSPSISVTINRSFNAAAHNANARQSETKTLGHMPFLTKEDDAMAQSMTPSKIITNGQIDKAVAVYRAMLEKHREELASEPAQEVLMQDDYVGEQVGVLRRRIEAISGLIIRRVAVNRTRTPQETLDATGRKQYTDRKVVDAMPRGEGDEAEVCFFNLGRFINDADLEKEYELRGFKPVDPFSLAAVNEADPAFADDHPNCTHWKDADGNWCYASFSRWRVGRGVLVNRDVVGWNDFWWFAGVRKPARSA